MLVELGNSEPTAAGAEVGAITTIHVPDTYTYVVADSAQALADESAAHLGRSLGGVTRLPDQEALVAVVACWAQESAGSPQWVRSDNHDFAVLLSRYFECPIQEATGE